MEDGYFEGAIVGVLICILITIIVIIANKGAKKKIEKIKSQVPKEIINVLSTSKFYNYEPNNNFLIGTSYIYEIVEEPARVIIKLLYHKIPFNKHDIDFDIGELYMSKEECEKHSLCVGECVTTLHNTAPEVRFKIKEILYDEDNK
jgi:aminopeptidase-like protein